MLSLSIISPEKKLLEIQCASATIPTTTGLITVLPSHAPLYSLLAPGEVTVRSDKGEESYYVVTTGILSVVKDKVSLLVDFGIRSDEIDEKMVEEAKARAQKLLEEKKDDESYATAKAEMFKALLQLNIASRRKRR